MQSSETWQWNFPRSLKKQTFLPEVVSSNYPPSKSVPLCEVREGLLGLTDFLCLAKYSLRHFRALWDILCHLRERLRYLLGVVLQAYNPTLTLGLRREDQRVWDQPGTSKKENKQQENKAGSLSLFMCKCARMWACIHVHMSVVRCLAYAMQVISHWIKSPTF